MGAPVRQELGEIFPSSSVYAILLCFFQSIYHKSEAISGLNDFQVSDRYNKKKCLCILGHVPGGKWVYDIVLKLLRNQQ